MWNCREKENESEINCSNEYKIQQEFLNLAYWTILALSGRPTPCQVLKTKTKIYRIYRRRWFDSLSLSKTRPKLRMRGHHQGDVTTLPGWMHTTKNWLRSLKCWPPASKYLKSICLVLMIQEFCPMYYRVTNRWIQEEQMAALPARINIGQPVQKASARSALTLDVLTFGLTW